ncbi:MAG: C40 family peptidase [Mycobacterium sp.]
MTSEVEILSRAHALFDGAEDVRPIVAEVDAAAAPGERQTSDGATARAHREVAGGWNRHLDRALMVDAELQRILARAHGDHQQARRDTAAVLAAAREDASVPDNPVAARELLRRRVHRLRTQQAHVLSARRRARRRRAALRALRYRMRHTTGPMPGGRAEIAVRAALSKLGRPYVWGATGPDRFDCSGLVQWAYAQAGVPLHRTTYDQIHDGIQVAPDRVRPGDLVFPHTGHVQMAIGGGMVVEAPYPGASVQISRIGPSVAIRRPV